MIYRQLKLLIKKFSDMSLNSLPTFFVPLVGLVLPLFTMTYLFLYIEKENREVFDPNSYKF
jgi:photosystem I reaction center subunit VIII